MHAQRLSTTRLSQVQRLSSELSFLETDISSRTRAYIPFSLRRTATDDTILAHPSFPLLFVSLCIVSCSRTLPSGWERSTVDPLPEKVDSLVVSLRKLQSLLAALPEGGLPA